MVFNVRISMCGSLDILFLFMHVCVLVPMLQFSFSLKVLIVTKQLNQSINQNFVKNLKFVPYFIQLIQSYMYYNL